MTNPIGPSLNDLQTAISQFHARRGSMPLKITEKATDYSSNKNRSSSIVTESSMTALQAYKASSAHSSPTLNSSISPPPIPTNPRPDLSTPSSPPKSPPPLPSSPPKRISVPSLQLNPNEDRKTNRTYSQEGPKSPPPLPIKSPTSKDEDLKTNRTYSEEDSLDPKVTAAFSEIFKKTYLEKMCQLASICADKNNIQEAIMWNKLAKAQGSTDAACKLGTIYEKLGQKEKAFKEYFETAQKGHTMAMYNLAKMHIELDKEINKIEAIKWLTKIVEKDPLEFTSDSKTIKVLLSEIEKKLDIVPLEGPVLIAKLSLGIFKRVVITDDSKLDAVKKVYDRFLADIEKSCAHFENKKTDNKESQDNFKETFARTKLIINEVFSIYQRHLNEGQNEMNLKDEAEKKLASLKVL